MPHIMCYGNNVFISPIKKVKTDIGVVCKGEIIAVGTTPTIELKKSNIVYYNEKDVSGVIYIKDVLHDVIPHYLIFGVQATNPNGEITD